jgi:hypothetical protein
MVYTIDELKAKIKPIAEKYDLPAVYVFGSYARGEATEDSDIDILIDKTGSKVKSLFDLGGLYNDLSEDFEKKVDIVTTYTLMKSPKKRRGFPSLKENVLNERVAIYE